MAERHQYPYGLIGNCSYTAHISKDGNVAWLCWPRFDSPFVFGNILDADRGGNFQIRPAENIAASRQYYLENTNILCTEFTTAEGGFRIVDMAPRFRQYSRYYKPLLLVRKIEYLWGNPSIIVSCKPSVGYTGGYAKVHEGSNHLQFEGFAEEVRLTTDIPLTFIRNERPFVLHENRYLVLTYGLPLETNLEYTCEDFLTRTTNYWRSWVKSSYIPSQYQDAIIRSSLALKIHQYEQTGAIIAAATTSLPEIPGRGRNWDYRYCWMRDSYYILTAFNNVGHFEELEQYFQYIANVSLLHKDRMQPLYSVEGLDKLDEYEADLAGYLGNKPVRIGNAAYTHIQNDVYGQVLVSLLPLYTDKRFNNKERTSSLDLIRRLLGMIEQTMNEPDAGLWEFRDRPNLHGYTFLFHWAGSAAAEKILRHFNTDDRMLKYASQLKEAAAYQLERCFMPVPGVYAESIGSTDLDFSMIQLITLGYLDGKSERAQQHLRVLEEQLSMKNALFFRYKHTDDFGQPEMAFLICSFWYVEALSLTGRLDEAQKSFEQLLTYGNHLGLFSEDVSAVDFSQWGNFPQAYSHVGLINAAFRIARHLDQPAFL